MSDCPDCRPFQEIPRDLTEQLKFYAEETTRLKQKVRDLETEIAVLKLNQEYFKHG